MGEHGHPPAGCAIGPANGVSPETRDPERLPFQLRARRTNMKINVTLPFDQIENPSEFLLPEAVVEIATLVERLGFNGGNVTDHPCPTGRWLDAGGHYAQDPFVM